VSNRHRANALFAVLSPLLLAATDSRAPVCINCHAKETEAYLKSPMGNSIAPPTPLAGGHVIGQQGAELSIRESDGRMIHLLAANGFTAEHAVAYEIGAGKIGYTYVVRIGDYLFESPASWYRKHGWDFSPGYGNMASADFDRLIDSSCLFCHSGNARFAGSDGRRFSGVALAPVSCERCHGPSEDHVRTPSSKNIVNPAKLPRRARDSVCEQCHLEGETRLLNPGKNWPDYRPGEELEHIAVTYLLTRGDREVRAVEQVEQLALSKCARASAGKLWCGTCHNPHREVTDRAREIRAICQGCHPTLSKAAHASVTECVSCHMPRLSADDIPHTASTDHRILRSPAPLPNGDTVGAEVSAWQDPPARFRARDLAVATLVIGGTHGITSLHDNGTKLLEALPAEQRDRDPAVLSSLVSVGLQRREWEQAKAYAVRTAEIQPDSGLSSLSLAIVLQNSGDDAGAERQLLHTIDLDPSLQPAWVNLSFLYKQLGREHDRVELLNRYLKWNPQSIWLRQLKAMLTEQH